MPIFQCSKCGCIENTALCHYWINRKDPICSECDPEIGKWHGRFQKRSAEGLLLANDGFLYSKEDVERGYVPKSSSGFMILKEIQQDLETAKPQ